MAGSLHGQGQRDSCTGVATAFTIVSVVLVGLRVYTRTVIIRNFGKDDWAMLLALSLTLGYLVAIYVLRENGMGFSGVTLTMTEMENLLKAALVIEILYYILIFSIKLSILFSYLRIAVAEEKFERLTRMTIWVKTVFVIVCVVCCLVQCVPLHKAWDPTGTVPGKCINTTAFFYFTSAFNILTDLWILALPIRALLSIQRPRREKVALIVAFSLGIFTCIASIVRLYTIRIYTQSKDPFYDSVPLNLLSMIEVNIGIWCASIPPLKALMNRAERKRSRNMGRSYYSGGKSGGTSSRFTERRIGSAGKTAGSLPQDSHDAVIANEGYGLSPVDRKEPRCPLQEAADARDASVGDSFCSGSEDNISLPGAYVKM